LNTLEERAEGILISTMVKRKQRLDGSKLK